MLISEVSWLPGTASPSFRTVQTATSEKDLPLPLKVTFVVTRHPALTRLAEIAPCLSLQDAALSRRIDATRETAWAREVCDEASGPVVVVPITQITIALGSRHTRVWTEKREIAQHRFGGLTYMDSLSPLQQVLQILLPEQLFGNGFAACCEDAALPFRKNAPLILGCALAFESEGAAQTSKGLDTEGQSRILTTGGKAEAIVFGCGSDATFLAVFAALRLVFPEEIQRRGAEYAGVAQRKILFSTESL